jgi:hypothetical protein
MNVYQFNHIVWNRKHNVVVVEALQLNQAIERANYKIKRHLRGGQTFSISLE